METKTSKNIGLTIPHDYYRKLKTLRRWADNKITGKGRPITNDDVYHYFRTLMEKLDSWLSDEVIKMGYGTEAMRRLWSYIFSQTQKL